MSWSARKASECSIYHLFVRGVGRQFIFADDADREKFVELFGREAGEAFAVLGWCLMDNHVHLLVRGSMTDISVAMQRLLATYARWFNARHGRVGHVFQDRFRSEPIVDEAHFKVALRYIHENPMKASMARSCDYPWSSYREYLQSPFLTDTEFALGVFGSLEALLWFHEHGDPNCECTLMEDEARGNGSRRACTEAELIAIAADVLGDSWRKTLLCTDRTCRNASLRKLKEQGLSVRQIERLSGIGRNIIARA